jgi:hypothetical protein
MSPRGCEVYGFAPLLSFIFAPIAFTASSWASETGSRPALLFAFSHYLSWLEAAKIENK